MIKEIIKQIEPKINGKLLYLSQFGSHLYGLNTENSDLDFRGVYIPNLDDIILHKDKDEINTEVTINIPQPSPVRKMDNGLEVVLSVCVTKRIKADVKIFSLQKFIQLCSKADTNALDLLFSTEEQLPYFHKQIEQYYNGYTEENEELINYIRRNRDKLINTDRLESPITYAFKQSEKYSIKGTRYKIMQDILVIINRILYNDYGMPIYENKNLQIKDCIKEFEGFFDNKHVKIDELDNKGKLEKYLYICGVQHQFNLPITTLANRVEEKVNKEYTSQRTIDASDGNDWKALSHAVRVLLEVQELMETGTIRFPLQQRDFLLDIKLGKIDREAVDEYFKEHLSGLMECIEQDTLDWKYDEDFWNKFIVRVTKAK